MIISFGWATEPLLAGKKTVTRRIWSNRTLTSWQHAWDRGHKQHDAYDKLPCWGGEKLGTITLTVRPYRSKLRDMFPGDLAKEGGLWDTVDEFCQQFYDRGYKPDQEVAVVRFEFTPDP